MVTIVPKSAALPPTPDSEPTDLPEKKSLGSVWILPMATWKPNRITPINVNARYGVAADAVPRSAANINSPPTAIADFRARFTLVPRAIKTCASTPPSMAPNAAPM